MSELIPEPDLVKTNRLRTKVWFYYLSERAGHKTPYWFWEKFDRGSSRSKWERYARGVHSARNRNGKHAVKLMSVHFPGSEKIFDSGIWEVLAGNSISDKRGTSDLMELRDVITGIAVGGGYWKNREPGDKIHIEDMMSQLKGVPEFDSLQAIILKMGMADNARNVNYWNGLCDLYNEMLPEFILDEEIPFRFELFELIDIVARRYEYREATHMFRSKQNWRDQLPRYKSLLKDIYSAGIRNHDRFMLVPDSAFPKKERERMVNYMIDIVWNDEDLKFRASELWKPLGEFYYEGLSGQVSNAGHSEERFVRLAKMATADWHRRKKLEDLEWKITRRREEKRIV